MLIQVGANIKLWNQTGRTALHFAASNSCNATLRELLSKGADPNKQVHRIFETFSNIQLKNTLIKIMLKLLHVYKLLRRINVSENYQFEKIVLNSSRY